MSLPEKFSLLLHSKQFENIQASFQTGRASHAYIIEGAKGSGKKSMASVLAAAFLCQAAQKPCFNCSSCRRILSGCHPDVQVYSSKKKTIPVEDMRQLIEQSGITAYEGGFGITIITDSHTATPEAQNCLLKTLEEPRGDHVFILLAENAELLLSTIRSRCRLIRLSGFSPESIQSQLSLLYSDPEKCRNAAHSCNGNIGNAIEMMESDRYWQQREIASKILQTAGSQGQPALISVLLQQNKDDIDTLLDILITLLSFSLQNTVREADPNAPPAAERIIVLQKIRAVQDAQYRLKSNVNFGLTIDTLSYNLVKGEKTWQRS